MSPRRPTVGGLLRMSLFGAVVGSLFDGFHTHSGMTSYPHPIVFLMAWWTPLIFAAAYTLLGLGFEIARPGCRPAAAASALGFAAFGALYFASGYLPCSNAAKLGVLLAGAALLWLALDRTRRTIVFAVVAAIVGPSVEILLVHLGLFAHLRPDFAGIPVWLPALYLAAATGGAPFMAWLGTSGEG